MHRLRSRERRHESKVSVREGPMSPRLVPLGHPPVWALGCYFAHSLRPGTVPSKSGGAVSLPRFPDFAPLFAFLKPLCLSAPTGENRISELEAENYALKTLLSKHQSEPMENKQSLPERATMLSQFAEAFDGQLSRLYNSLNTLDAISNRLVANKEDGIKGNAPEAQDLSSRLSNLIGYFSHQNDRLDMLNAKLSDLI